MRRARRSPIVAAVVAWAFLLHGTVVAADDEVITFIQADGSGMLAVADAQGGSLDPLTGFLGNNIPPRLSPDGGTIAYVRTADQDGQGPGLWLIGIDGTGAERIRTHETFQHAQMLAWSPDGSLVAWARWMDDRIRLVDRDGQAQGTIAVCTNLVQPRVTGFDWGRDGRLWVGCHAEGSSTHRLRVMPPSGGAGTQRHQSNEAVVRIRVDPAGARALVHTQTGTTLLVRPTDKVEVPALSGAWAWSPSGERLIGSAGAVLFTIGQGGGNSTSLGVQGFVPDWGPVPGPRSCAEGIAEPDNGGKLILGTGGDDVLEGTSGDDVICGFGGDDTIRGLGGRDYIDGGSGDDLLKGGGGGDYLHGRSGKDRLEGGSGVDFLGGGSGRDRLIGGSGGDELKGHSGNDRLEGGSGDDLLDGGDGHDTLLGGADDDVLLGRSGDDVLEGEHGRDRLAGHGGSDTLRGGPGNDHLTGGSRKDRLEGEGGNDTIEARDGIRDVVRGGPGSDKARIDPGKDDVTSVETLLP